MDTTEDYYKLTLQQQRFCDEYLIHFNAFKAAANAGYSENTARKGELLHLPKIQLYLKDQMRRTQSRLEITHDMILTELAKIAFSNMGNYFDEYAVLKPMHKLSADEKAAISQYQVLDATDEYGHRVGELSKIKLHNKMAALDKIARHLGFYEVGRKSESPEVRKMVEEYQVASIRYQDEEKKESLKSESPEVRKMEDEYQVASIRYQDDEKEESLKSESPEAEKMAKSENLENILTLSPLRQLLKDRLIDGVNLESGSSSGGKQEARWGVGGNGEFALGTEADTGPVANACAV